MSTKNKDTFKAYLYEGKTYFIVKNDFESINNEEKSPNLSHTTWDDCGGYYSNSKCHDEVEIPLVHALNNIDGNSLAGKERRLYDEAVAYCKSLKLNTSDKFIVQGVMKY